MSTPMPTLRQEQKISVLAFFWPATGTYSVHRFDASGLRLIRRFGPVSSQPKPKKK